MALDANKPAQDWYLRFLNPDPFQPVVLKEFTLDQLFSTGASDPDPITIAERTDTLPVSRFVEGGLVLGRLSRKTKNDVKTGLFSAAVLSRHHAQLVVKNSGHVYIVDLASRHGSYLKNGDTRKIQPFTPTQLLQGDILVLGTRLHGSKQDHMPVQVRVAFNHAMAGRPTGSVRGELTTHTPTRFASSDARERILARVVPSPPVDIPKSLVSKIIDLSKESPAPPGNSGTNPISVVDEDESIHVTDDDVAAIPSPAFTSDDCESIKEDPDSPKSKRGYGLPDSVLYSSDDDEDLPRGTVSASPEAVAANVTAEIVVAFGPEEEAHQAVLDFVASALDCDDEAEANARKTAGAPEIIHESPDKSSKDESFLAVSSSIDDVAAIASRDVSNVPDAVEDDHDIHTSSDMDVEESEEDDFNEEEDFNEDPSDYDEEDDEYEYDDAPQVGQFPRLKYTDVFVDSEEYYSDEEDVGSDAHGPAAGLDFFHSIDSRFDQAEFARPTIAAITHEEEVEVGEANRLGIPLSEIFEQFAGVEEHSAPQPADVTDVVKETAAVAVEPASQRASASPVFADAPETLGNEDASDDDDYKEDEDQASDQSSDPEDDQVLEEETFDSRELTSHHKDELPWAPPHTAEDVIAIASSDAPWDALVAQAALQSVERESPIPAREQTPDLCAGSDVSSEGPVTPTVLMAHPPILKRKRNDEDEGQGDYAAEGQAPSPKVAKTTAGGKLWPVTAAFALGTILGGAGTIVGLMQYGA